MNSIYMEIQKQLLKLLLGLLLSIQLTAYSQNIHITKSSFPPEQFQGGVFIGYGAKLYSLDTIFVEPSDSVINCAWENYSGSSLSGSTLVKTATDGWGNAGSISYNQLKSLQNGWISFEVADLTKEFKFGYSRDTVIDYDSIDYAIHVASGAISVYNGSTLIGSFGTVTTGDLLQIERIGDVMAFTKNHAIFYNQQVSPWEELQVNTSLYTESTAILVQCSFGLGNLYKPYCTLRKKLDGGFYLPILNKLYFKFDGEYNDGTLNYVVTDNSTGSTHHPSINTSTQNYGDNRYEMDLAGTFTPSGNYYTLAVTNEKNVTYYLKFKY